MAPPRRYLARWTRDFDVAQLQIISATALLCVLFGVGTAGYRIIEGWPFIDGFYMTFITLATIGFQEVHPLSPVGRLFTVFIGLTGIGLVTFVATRAAQLLLASENFYRRQMKQRIKDLTDHYIVCGYGRVGQRLAEDLEKANRPFVVVERDPEVIEDIAANNHLYIEGDAEEEETLTAAGIHRSCGLILALPDDSSNVFVTLTAREMNPDVAILTRTMDHRNRSKLLHAGADKVVAPSEVGADRMAQVVLRPNVDQFLEHVLHTGSLSLQMEEVRIKPGAPLAGQTLAESNFRQQYDAVVIGIIDQSEQTMHFNPAPSDRIQTGDVLIVLGDPATIETLRREGCSP
ncbi:potassium channel family protein [Salisaeta longa]|uniref:potassium channel family protein n=1 Tax=Salisaeta longa TaxID=503170 RepID=UPI0003B52104|nr:potassium channel protein [Salisaeta longa]